MINMSCESAEKEIVKYLEGIVAETGQVGGYPELSKSKRPKPSQGPNGLYPGPYPGPYPEMINKHTRQQQQLKDLSKKALNQTAEEAVKAAKKITEEKIGEVEGHIKSAYQLVIDLNKKINDPEIQYMILPVLISQTEVAQQDQAYIQYIELLNELQTAEGGHQVGGGVIGDFFFACFNCNHANSRIRTAPRQPVHHVLPLPRVPNVQPQPRPRQPPRQQQQRYENVGLPPPWHQQRAHVAPPRVEQPEPQYRTTFVDAADVVEEIQRAEKSLDYLGRRIARIIYGENPNEQIEPEPGVLNYVKNFCVKRYNELYFSSIPQLGNTGITTVITNEGRMQLAFGSAMDKVKAEAYFTFLVASFIEISNMLNKSKIQNNKLVISFVININGSHFLEIRKKEGGNFKTYFDNAVIDYETLDDTRYNLYKDYIYGEIPPTLTIMHSLNKEYTITDDINTNYLEFMKFINTATGTAPGTGPGPSASGSVPEYMRYKNVFLRAKRKIAEERRAREEKGRIQDEAGGIESQSMFQIIKDLTAFSEL